jgi:hypothetical protein
MPSARTGTSLRLHSQTTPTPINTTGFQFSEPKTHVSIQKRQIRNGFFTSNVRQRPLMRVMERSQLARLVDLLHHSLNLLCRLLCLGRRRRTQLGQAFFELFFLSDLTKESGEVSAFLGGDLGGGCVGSCCTLSVESVESSGLKESKRTYISDGKDPISTLHTQKVVHRDTPLICLVLGEVLHQVARDWATDVSSRPDDSAEWNFDAFASCVLDNDGFFFDFFDHGLTRTT